MPLTTSTRFSEMVIVVSGEGLWQNERPVAEMYENAEPGWVVSSSEKFN